MSIDSKLLIAKKNMIEGQLKPAGVVSSNLLSAFFHIGRENFLPTDGAEVDSASLPKTAVQVYSDKNFFMPHGRVLWSPRVSGSLLEISGVQKNDKVLVLAGAMGYECNLLAEIGVAVVALTNGYDRVQKLVRRSNFELVESSNVAIGYPDKAPYQAIFLLGAVPAVPKDLLQQLTPTGLVLTILLDSQSRKHVEIASTATISNKLVGDIVAVTKQGQIRYYSSVMGLEPLPELVQHYQRLGGITGADSVLPKVIANKSEPKISYDLTDLAHWG